ncbi:MAG TPA: hypothetical protein VFS40_02205 [Gemmatimonadales bacterium]|nr:hypothetical protein [Gemmatimonadales bacterium]
MSLFRTLAAAALVAGAAPLATVSATPAEARPVSPGVVADTGATLKVTVDSSKHIVRILAGPFDLQNMPAMDDHGMMDHGMTHDTPLYRFAWPVEGWMRGFEWRLKAADGSVVPREVMHHMIMVNLSRRQLLYNAAERLLGAGSETEDISVPKTIGVPMQPGADLGFYIAWHNSTGHDLKGVYLEFDMLWMPKNQAPRPVNALPLYMDVNLTVGGTNTYDVPPGHSEKSWEFTMPINGKILGLGGHMHDYGAWVKLVDAENGKELARVTAKRTKEGKILGVSRKLFGVSGEGLKVKAGHRYRVVGAYDNPTGVLQKNGAMAHMSGLFTPDNLADWPAIDRSDSTFKVDMASLNLDSTGAPLARPAATHGGHDMEHMHHGAAASDSTGHDMADHDMSDHDMSGHDMSGHDMSGHEMSGQAASDSAAAAHGAHPHTHQAPAKAPAKAPAPKRTAKDTTKPAAKPSR